MWFSTSAGTAGKVNWMCCSDSQPICESRNTVRRPASEKARGSSQFVSGCWLGSWPSAKLSYRVTMGHLDDLGCENIISSTGDGELRVCVKKENGKCPERSNPQIRLC